MSDNNYLTWWNSATPKEKVAHHSRRLTKYFECVTNNEKEQNSERAFEWYLGLYLASQLLRISETENFDLPELDLIVKILEVDRRKYGSGWNDLYWQAKSLLDNLSEENPHMIDEIKNVSGK